MSLKKHNGGLGNFLNELTQTSEKNSREEKITYIDIDELESNPKNFYGLRDIDSLASLISVSKLIEPLIVVKNPDGKYKIISGHRRHAAVKKLIEEGIFDKKKLPCIVKTLEKIKIEQKNGETIEFDEDAVEMLNLIASNRGQREERTIDEKLQEIKHLAEFAKAIYNQKSKGRRGRFVNFFAEEVLTISKSQLLRINSLEKLTDEVKRATDEKKISETAAQMMATMTAESQNACLKKILSGEIRGTVQEIQKFKSKPFIEKNPSKATKREGLTAKNIIDVPEKFSDPQQEAEEWFYQEKISFYKTICDEAMRLSNKESDELKAAQWLIRASVARYNLEELKLQHEQLER